MTIETIHRGAWVWRTSATYTGCDHDKKREQTLRKNRRGRWECDRWARIPPARPLPGAASASSGWRAAQSFGGILLPFSRTWRYGIVPARWDVWQAPAEAGRLPQRSSHIWFIDLWQELTREQPMAAQEVHQRRLRIGHVRA